MSHLHGARFAAALERVNVAAVELRCSLEVLAELSPIFGPRDSMRLFLVRALLHEGEQLDRRIEKFLPLAARWLQVPWP